MTHIDLILHQNNKDEITSFLESSGIRFSEREVFSVSPSFDQVLLFIDSMPWESIAAIIVAWIARKPKRRVKFTFIDNTCVDATNYSTEELKDLLSVHRQANMHLQDEGDSESK